MLAIACLTLAAPVEREPLFGGGGLGPRYGPGGLAPLGPQTTGLLGGSAVPSDPAPTIIGLTVRLHLEHLHSGAAGPRPVARARQHMPKRAFCSVNARVGYLGRHRHQLASE